MKELERIKELVQILNEASKAYYQESKEIMSNLEYDRMYDELVELEKKTGVTLANSPTVNVGYEVISELPKETHDSPMLSLDKTKDIDSLAAFAGERESLLSWKLDGLTVVLTYNEGKLEKAVTRGNGIVGEVITNNAKTFKNIPINISYKGQLIIRGEAVIKYSDFEKINQSIVDVDAKYKNPRNLCAGSVRQLNNEITAKRNVQFFAFALISAPGIDFHNSMKRQMEWLEEQGFQTVEHKVVTQDNMREAVEYFAEKIKTFDIPSDGLVLMYDDIAYGISLGSTAKFPRNGIAFKWADEQAETKLKYIEWSASRTGLINPVAVFEPVELEGTTVSRASVHNVSIVQELELGEEDKILVYKANMIIPQIAENLTRSNNIEIPTQCPICMGKTIIKNENGIKTLYCENSKCPAKHVKAFSHFVSRDGMNIEGLSEETLEKFIDEGYIKEFADIYHLDRFKDEIINKKGFGEKSYKNITDAIEKSRKVTLPAFVYSLGIANIGISNAKMICRKLNSIDKIRSATVEELISIDRVGEIMAEKFVDYFNDEENNRKLNNLLVEVDLYVEESNDEQVLEGKTFVITGKVNKFANRNELKKFIEDRGGKVTGSVTGNTDYLINNDINSSSSKNKKAKELGVEIIDEKGFMALI